MPMSLTLLRQQLFKVVDQVIRTGIPTKIRGNGHIVKILLAYKKSKLDDLVEHDCIVGDPVALVDLSIHEWDEKSRL